MATGRLRQLARHLRGDGDGPLPALASEQEEEFDRTPILVGVARVTPRVEMEAESFPPGPIDHMEQMARQALEDTGIAPQDVIDAVSGIAISGPPSRMFPNMAGSLGARLGVAPETYTHQRAMGGDAVQAVTNLMAGRIAEGHDGVIVCAHAMTVETQRQFYRQVRRSRPPCSRSRSRPCSRGSRFGSSEPAAGSSRSGASICRASGRRTPSSDPRPSSAAAPSPAPLSTTRSFSTRWRSGGTGWTPRSTSIRSSRTRCASATAPASRSTRPRYARALPAPALFPAGRLRRSPRSLFSPFPPFLWLAFSG